MSNRAVVVPWFWLAFGFLLGLLAAGPSFAEDMADGKKSEAVSTDQNAGAASDEDWDEFDEPPEIQFDPAEIRQMGVRSVPLEEREVQRRIRTFGMVTADERLVKRVSTRVAGWIERLHVDYEGKPVAKGDPIAEIYSPELVATQEEFLLALEWLERGGTGDSGGAYGEMLRRDAEKILEAARSRLMYWDVSAEQIEELKRSREPSRTITVFSEADGFVRNKQVDAGSRVMAGQPLMEIVDLSQVWILADIYVSEMSFVQVGQTANIALSAFPGEPFTSRITYVYPTLQSATRTTQVRFEVPNAGLKLKPMMFSDVEIMVNLGKRWVLPDDAVIDTGKEQVVYVDLGEGRYRPKKVTLGVRAGKYREVLSGIAAGEKVAAGANFLLDSEAQLRGIFPE